MVAAQEVAERAGERSTESQPAHSAQRACGLLTVSKSAMDRLAGELDGSGVTIFFVTGVNALSTGAATTSRA